jgi:hypothetical protein
MEIVDPEVPWHEIFRGKPTRKEKERQKSKKGTFLTSFDKDALAR